MRLHLDSLKSNRHTVSIVPLAYSFEMIVISIYSPIMFYFVCYLIYVLPHSLSSKDFGLVLL